VRAVQDPQIKQRYLSGGGEPAPSASPEAFREFIRAEGQKWARSSATRRSSRNK
jgi:hypothetical protein